MTAYRHQIIMRWKPATRRARQKECKRMSWKRLGVLGTGVTFAVAMAVSAGGAAAFAAQTAPAAPAAPAALSVNHPTFIVHRIGTAANGTPLVTSASPTGLPPSAIKSVYGLSGLSPGSGAGDGQIIAIVDAYNDPHALADLNVFNKEYGYAKLVTCTSLSQPGPCFKVAKPSGKPATNSDWALEESLDIEWAHAEAPAAKIVLVEAKTASNAHLYAAVDYANTTLDANVVSMSWGGGESSSETSSDRNFTHPGTLYTASSGDSGHGVIYPSASPDVIAVGGTTLNGCSGTSCAGFTSETAWPGSGGGISAYENIPAYQAGYAGAVHGATTISSLTGGLRGVPDVSFVGDPNTGVSVYDSTLYAGQSGWWTIGGTSVGAPNWAGILAAGNAAGKTALQGDAAIYGGGYLTNLRDIISGSNGSCGTDCGAGTGYDLVTGLGSPVNYP